MGAAFIASYIMHYKPCVANLILSTITDMY